MQIIIALLAVLTFNGPEGFVARIADERCIDPDVLRYIAPKARDSFRRAEVISEGIAHSACWRVDRRGHVYIIDHERRGAVIPLIEFNRTTNT